MSYRIEVLRDDPLGYWRLNEQTGDFLDSGGVGDLVVSGGWTRGAASLLRSDPDAAATPNGTTGYAADTSPSGLPTGAAARTLEFWAVNTDVAPSHNDCVLSYGTLVVPQGCGANLANVNRVLFWTVGNDVFWDVAGSRDGNPHHYVLTYNGVTTAELFYDGVSQTTKTFGSALNTVVDANGLVIGKDFFQAAGYFGGTLDEIAIYDGVLSAARIASHYAAGVGPVLRRPTLQPHPFQPGTTR